VSLPVVGRVRALSHSEGGESAWIEVGALRFCETDGSLSVELLAVPFSWDEPGARRLLRIEPRTIGGEPLDLRRPILAQVAELRAPPAPAPASTTATQNPKHARRKP
jgi:hypothetical protein